MNIAPLHLATIKNRKLEFLNKEGVVEWIKTLLNKGVEDVEVIIRKKKNLRTERQHRYWWVYMYIIEQETGDSKDVLHEFFKQKFLTYKEEEVMGEMVKIYQSTTKISKQEFSNLIRSVEILTDIPAPTIDKWNFE